MIIAINVQHLFALDAQYSLLIMSVLDLHEVPNQQENTQKVYIPSDLAGR